MVVRHPYKMAAEVRFFQRAVERGGANNYGPVLSLHENSISSNGSFDAQIYDGSNPLCALSSRGHIYIMFTAGGAPIYDVPDFMDKLANIVVAFN